MNIGTTTWTAWDDTALPLRRAQSDAAVIRQAGQLNGVVVQDAPHYVPAQVTTWSDGLDATAAATLRGVCEGYHDDADVVSVTDSRGRVWTCRVLGAVVDIFDVVGGLKAVRCIWTLYPSAGPT